MTNRPDPGDHTKSSLKAGGPVLIRAGILFFIIPTTQLHGRSDPAFRVDLKSGLHASICRDKKAPTLKSLWVKKIHDSGMILRILQKKDSGPVSERKLQILAKSMAIRSEHRSYSYGVCDENQGWVLSSPAPGPLLSEHKLTRTFIAKHAVACKKMVAEWASLKDTSTRILISSEELTAETKVSGDPAGMISLSCLPAAPSWAGPELWYLFPSEKIRPDEVFKNSIWANGSGQEDLEQEMIQWIHQVRKFHKLSSLDTSQVFVRDTARFLTLSGSVRHDRRDLQDIRSSFLKNGIEFLGENRVIAQSSAAMSQLFWFSPAHRRLILHPDADVGAVSYDSDTGLLVFILGRSNRNPVAQSSQSSGADQKR